MEKRTTKAFGKEIYLLGKDNDGILYWLESPTWDCGWYWGCGYIETYANNTNPSIARDINSHQHFDGLFFNKSKNGFDAFKEFFTDSTVSDKELWTLMELMRTIYTLKETAEVLGRGGSHYTTNPCKEIVTNHEEVKRINEVVLPALFKEVRNLLSE